MNIELSSSSSFQTTALQQNFAQLARLPEETILKRIKKIEREISGNKSMLSKEIYAELVTILLMHGDAIPKYQQSAKKLMVIAREVLGGFDQSLKDKIQAFAKIRIISGDISANVHGLLSNIPEQLLVKKQLVLPKGFSKETLESYNDYLWKGSIDCNDVSKLYEMLRLSKFLQDETFNSLCESHYVILKIKSDHTLVTEEDAKLLTSASAPVIFKEYFKSKNNKGELFFTEEFLLYLLIHASPATAWMRTIPFTVEIKSLPSAQNFYLHLCLSSDLCLNQLTIQFSNLNQKALIKFFEMCESLYKSRAADDFFKIDCKFDDNVTGAFTSFARCDLLKEGNNCLQLLRKAYELDTKNIYTLTTFAEYYLGKDQDLDKAKNYVEKALEIDPNCKKAKSLQKQINEELAKPKSPTIIDAVANFLRPKPKLSDYDTKDSDL